MLDVVAASPASGVDTLTGEEPEEALDGAGVVVDVSKTTGDARWRVGGFDGHATMPSPLHSTDRLSGQVGPEERKE